jgi:8-oxo-dGTP pyrophosphatase MutT (NUDIX family)
MWDLSDHGLRVIHLKSIVLPSQAIEYIYRDSIGKHFYEDMHAYLARNAVTALMLEHSVENAQQVLLDLKTGGNGKPNLRKKYRRPREWIDDAELELWNRGLVEDPADLTIALTQDNVLHTADDTEDAILSLAALSIYESGFLTIDDIKYRRLGNRLGAIIDLGDVVDSVRRDVMSRTWYATEKIARIDEKHPVNQVYVWALTSDNKIPIVSKTGESWQLPGGKPIENESLLDTAIRELREETGISSQPFMENFDFFGYYEIIEDGANKKPYHYLQVRYALHLPIHSDQLPRAPLEEDDEQIESEQIRFVKYVTPDTIANYIPWMKESAETQAALAILAAPLTQQ